MDGPPAVEAPTNGQTQRQKKSARNNQQQWRRKNQHNSNHKHRIPPQQQKHFKRRGNSRRGGQTELGFFGSVPSLQDLQRENRKRTRRYYGNKNSQQHGAFPGSSVVPILTKLPPYFPHYLSNENIDSIRIDNNKPKCPWLSPTGRFLAPPAAPPPARFPGAELANPLATPTLAANQDGAADKLEAEGLHAGLDFFATNDGLVLYNDTPVPSWTEDEDENDGEMDSHSLSGSEDDDHDGNEDNSLEHGRRARLLRRPAGSTLAGNGFGGGIGGSADAGIGSSAYARIIQRLREKVAQQDAYIAELEDDNLRYNERLDLLRHQLREKLEESDGGPAEGIASDDMRSNENEMSKEPEPTAAPAAAEVTIMNGNEKDRVDDGSEMNESPALKA